jgi:hypothetical protein
MDRIKNLSIPLLSALAFSSILTANAQSTTSVEFSVDKTYRQSKSGLKFGNGEYKVAIQDGLLTVQAGCVRRDFWFPNIIGDPCSRGATGQILSGGLLSRTSVPGTEFGSQIDSDGARFFTVTGIKPALLVEQGREQEVALVAAPASTFARPSKGFRDQSYSIFFNLQDPNALQYDITRYERVVKYGSKQREKFDKDIVPGVYVYQLPLLRAPGQSAVVRSTINGMIGGVRKINNQTSGFQFDQIGKNKWRKNGFAEMSVLSQNRISWEGANRGNITAADQLYVSIRVLESPVANSKVNRESEETGLGQSIFPAFSTANSTDQRVKLPSPVTSSYTLPPNLLRGGTKGVFEVEFKRTLPQGISFDVSSRKFQIPVEFVNRYSEYASIRLAKSKNAGLLDDADGDGFNNMTEWLLGGTPNLASSQPVNPVPAFRPATFRNRQVDFGSFIRIFSQPLTPAFFGFEVDRELGTVPAVTYEIQRSTDNGVTWSQLITDANWNVESIVNAAGNSIFGENSQARSFIRVSSRVLSGATAIQPPGAVGHLFRVKISRTP